MTPTTTPRVRTQLVCPQCGSTHLSTIERAIGLGNPAGIYWVTPAAPAGDQPGPGGVDVEWGGGGVDMGSAVTIGAECNACLWRVVDDNWASELAPIYHGPDCAGDCCDGCGWIDADDVWHPGPTPADQVEHQEARASG